jgi:hypothetical protein
MERSWLLGSCCCGGLFYAQPPGIGLAWSWADKGGAVVLIGQLIAEGEVFIWLTPVVVVVGSRLAGAQAVDLLSTSVR